jgi:hypothetical protein
MPQRQRPTNGKSVFRKGSFFPHSIRAVFFEVSLQLEGLAPRQRSPENVLRDRVQPFGLVCRGVNHTAGREAIRLLAAREWVSDPYSEMKKLVSAYTIRSGHALR